MEGRVERKDTSSMNRRMVRWRPRLKRDCLEEKRRRSKGEIKACAEEIEMVNRQQTDQIQTYQNRAEQPEQAEQLEGEHRQGQSQGDVGQWLGATPSEEEKGWA